jgi:hypothetical protein
VEPLNGWTGVQQRLPDGFRMLKAGAVYTHVAVCETWTNPDGWELRLIVEGFDLPTTTVVRSADEMRTLVEAWRSSLVSSGWS